MKLNNRKKAVKLRRLFYLVSVLIAVGALVLFLLDFTLLGLVSVGVFSLWYLFFHVADYQFIEFSTNSGKIILRFYKAVKLGKPEFSAIEFPQEILYEALFESSVFGKYSDLTLAVKTKRGVAEYPSVSLSAVNKIDREKIFHALSKWLPRK